MDCHNCSRSLIIQLKNGTCTRIDVSDKHGAYCNIDCMTVYNKRRIEVLKDKKCFLCRSPVLYYLKCQHCSFHLCSEECINIAIKRICRTRTNPNIVIKKH